MLIQKCKTLMTMVLCVFCQCQSTHSFTSSKIPPQLVKCYISNGITNEYKSQPPLTQKTLVELIRKLEHNRTEPNIRILSNAILHIAKFDGIQHSSVNSPTAGIGESNIGLPYRASGQQFFKYQLLVDHLTPDVNAESQFPQSLEDHEFCLLHNLISSILDSRRRIDEKYTCHKSVPMMRLRDSSRNGDKEYLKSDCPEQKGVMKTKWGTVSAGPIIAGIASALQREKVPLKQLLNDLNLKNVTLASLVTKSENIDNIWMATLAGSLAQAVINQVSEHPRISSLGRWNDTLLPRGFYLNGDHWDINDADMLGAIDGLILAIEVRKWLDTYPAASLSQLIDMYYSNHGVAYDRTIRACDRGKKLTDLILHDELQDFVNHVTSATKVLNAFGSYENVIHDEKIEKLSKAVVEQFVNAADTLIQTYPDCDKTEDNIGRCEIILIADQTYSVYDIERLLAALIEETDVSYYSSSIGLLSGNQGKWILNITNDVIRTFTNLSAAPNSNWPTGLSLTRCLHEIIARYQNVIETSCSSYQRPYGKVIVVLAQSSYLTDDDLSTAQRSIDSIKNISPETRIIYVTSSETGHSKSFNQLERQWPGNSATVSADNLQETVSEISKELRRLPASIITFYCNGSKSNFEDYLTPDLTTVYEINSKYVAAATETSISVKFQTKGYGDISICAYEAYSTLNKTCKHITVNDEVTFKIEDHCSRDSACSVQFLVWPNNSALKCSAFECRYPDQVLINIETSWNQAPTHLMTSWSLILVIALLYYQI